MSFYRSIIAGVAAMGLATAVLADESTSATNATNSTDNSASSKQMMMQTADAASQSATSAPSTDASADNSKQVLIQTADAAPAAGNSMDAVKAEGATDTSAAADQTKVNINKATVKQLMKIKGLTAAKAKAIVAFRKKHGEFKTLDELSNVKGFKKMNEETMKGIQDQLTIG